MTAGIARWLTATLDVYRNAAGTGLALQTASVACMPLMPYSPGANMTVAYPNLKPFDNLETYIATNAVQKGDYIQVSGVKYAVAAVIAWPAIDSLGAFWEIVVEAAR